MTYGHFFLVLIFGISCGVAAATPNEVLMLGAFVTCVVTMLLLVCYMAALDCKRLRIQKPAEGQ